MDSDGVLLRRASARDSGVQDEGMNDEIPLGEETLLVELVDSSIRFAQPVMKRPRFTMEPNPHPRSPGLVRRVGEFPKEEAGRKGTAP